MFILCTKILIIGEVFISLPPGFPVSSPPPYTSSCDRHPDEGRLRYAPLSAAGLPFVDSEDKEGQDIDADEVYEDCSHLSM